MKRWCDVCRYLPALKYVNLCRSCLDHELAKLGDREQPSLRVGPFRLVERVDARSEFV